MSTLIKTLLIVLLSVNLMACATSEHGNNTNKGKVIVGVEGMYAQPSVGNLSMNHSAVSNYGGGMGVSMGYQMPSSHSNVSVSYEQLNTKS